VSERLQKFLARAGVASRRHAEGLITAGRVSVNNQRVTELGTKVEPTDLVTVDGKLVTVPEHSSWYLLHKPPGVVTTLSDPEGRPTVAGLLEGVEQRVFPVGRLDWDAEGALLLTNDGGAAHRLLHPSFEVPRTYLVKVKGTPADATLDRLREGVRLEDGPARAIRAERFEATERNTWLLLQVGEGRPHLVKRLCAAVGHPVVRLFRPAQAGISVAGLQPGELRTLTADEVQRVEAVAAGGTVPEPAPFLPPRRHGRAGEEGESLEAGEGSGTFAAPAGQERPERLRPARAGASGGRARPERGSRPRGRDLQRGRFDGTPWRGPGATGGGFDRAGVTPSPLHPVEGQRVGLLRRKVSSARAGATPGAVDSAGGRRGEPQVPRAASVRVGVTRGPADSVAGQPARRAAPDGGFRPRGRDIEHGRFAGGPSRGAAAPDGGFRPRGRDTRRGRFSGRSIGRAGAPTRLPSPRAWHGPSRFGGASVELVPEVSSAHASVTLARSISGRARARRQHPRAASGLATRAGAVDSAAGIAEARAAEGGFRPRGRDTQRGRWRRAIARKLAAPRAACDRAGVTARPAFAAGHRAHGAPRRLPTARRETGPADSAATHAQECTGRLRPRGRTQAVHPPRRSRGAAAPEVLRPRGGRAGRGPWLRQLPGTRPLRRATRGGGARRPRPGPRVEVEVGGAAAGAEPRRSPRVG
jgi:23S rRNA pseudouridine2605 synthase